MREDAKGWPPWYRAVALPWNVIPSFWPGGLGWDRETRETVVSRGLFPKLGLGWKGVEVGLVARCMKDEVSGGMLPMERTSKYRSPPVCWAQPSLKKSPAIRRSLVPLGGVQPLC